MLLISRRAGQSFVIGQSVVVVRQVQGGNVKLGIAAPQEIAIERSEIIDEERRERIFEYVGYIDPDRE